MYYSMTYPSIVGDLHLLSDGKSLVGLWMDDHKYKEDIWPLDVQEDSTKAILQQTKKWLDDYFAEGQPDINELELAPLKQTPFRQVIWNLLKAIPYGQVVTYGYLAQEAAKKMGKERMSSQAVGGAVGHNPISIIVPCHRVVGTNGSLTGYGGGIPNKIRLLEHEKVDLNPYHIPLRTTAP